MSDVWTQGESEFLGRTVCKLSIFMHEDSRRSYTMAQLQWWGSVPLAEARWTATRGLRARRGILYSYSVHVLQISIFFDLSSTSLSLTYSLVNVLQLRADELETERLSLPLGYPEHFSRLTPQYEPTRLRSLDSASIMSAPPRGSISPDVHIN